jgi:hypothetical protein
VPENIKKSFDEIKKIFEQNTAYIPMLQRNYKWSPATAANLAYDLLNTWCDNPENEKILGLLTVYQKDEENKKIEIIDGQQRIISLSILEKIFNEPRKISLLFERDFQLKNEYETRKTCIDICLSCRMKFDCPEFKDDKISTDWKRFYINYQAMLFPITVETLLDCLCRCNNDEKWSLDRGKLIEKLKKINRKDLFGTGYENKEDIREVHSMEDAQYEDLADKIAENEEILNNCNFIKNNKDYSITESYEAVCVMHELNKIRRGINVCVNYENNNLSCGSLLNYLREKVFFYWNLTTTEPIKEFLSINQDKTDFVVYDYAKATMILETTDEGKRKEILDNFSEIAAILYSKKESGYMWNLLKRGYKASNNKGEIKGEEWENRENRLKILFDERYGNGQLYGFNTDDERLFIQYCLKILNEIKDCKKNIFIMRLQCFIYMKIHHFSYC